MSIPEVGEGKRGSSGYLLYLLRQASTVVQQATDRQLAPHGLTLAQYSALTMIAAYDGLSSADLAKLSMLTPQSAHETVQRLLNADLVRRRPKPGHRRVLLLEITDEGRRLLALARRSCDEIEAALEKQARRCDEQAVRRWLVDIATELAADEPIVDASVTPAR